MVNKKGFIRTLEAVIAIMLVFGFLLFILPRRTAFAESTTPEGVESSRDFILNEILSNQTIRECLRDKISIVDLGSTSSGFNCSKTDCWTGVMEPVIKASIVPSFKIGCEICDHVSPCTNLPIETMRKSIYPGAAFIYFDDDNIKYVRVYFWKE